MNKIEQLFTEKERLYYRLKYDRFMEIIKKDDVELLQCRESTNSYGQFLFITIKYQNDFMVFYGLGYHETKDRHIYDTMNYYTGNDFLYEDLKAMDKNNTIKIIQEKHEETKEKNTEYEQSEQGQKNEILYNMVGDDDATLSLINSGLSIEEFFGE